MKIKKTEGILLHCCCGPCAEYPLQQLSAENYQPTLYYFNPNIQPQAEWQRRYESLAKLSDLLDLSLVATGAAATEQWLSLPDQAERCRFCYRLRLEEAARYAQANRFPVFSTTLLVSPYQKHEMIVEIGQELADSYGLKFLAADWRPGFRAGQQWAREHGLYRQRYCGCIFSLEESSFKERIKAEHARLEQGISDRT